MVKTIAIIPARYGSHRLIGKPLLELCGIPIVVRTYRSVLAAARVDDVVVATDDDRIASVVRQSGGKAIMTSPGCENGTIRVLEAARRVGRRYDIVVNVQGDEPLVNPKHVDTAVELVYGSPRRSLTRVDVGTLASRITTYEVLSDPNAVKCVVDHRQFALYFSRAAIPFARSGHWSPDRTTYLRHIGVYAFRRSFLFRHIPRMDPSDLEECEQLEQLRWLQHGARIKVAEAAEAFHGVDTADDIRSLTKLLSQRDEASTQKTGAP